MTKQPPPCRLSAIVAYDAPVAVVFRRGPSQWFQVLRWNLDTQAIEPGAWVRKKIFTDKCDLSGDGQLLFYYIAGSFPGGYRVYVGISRTPWLHALTSWEEIGTYGGGYAFVDEPSAGATGDVQRVDLDGRTVHYVSNPS